MFWDGTRWVDETQSPTRSSSPVTTWIATLLMVALLPSLLLVATRVDARRPAGSATAQCSVSGDRVVATGLPNETLINLVVTDADGSWSWVLGSTDDGTWAVSVPARSGQTRYEFASRTFGREGTKYWTYTTCWAT